MLEAINQGFYRLPGGVHLRRAACSCAHFRISLSAGTSPSFRIWVAFISPVLTLACLPAICPCLHRHCLDPELKIPHSPRQLMQLINNWTLGLQAQSKGIPAYQSSSVPFCSVNPRHGNIGRAMSSHSHAPNSRNTSCCPKFHLKCTHREKEDTRQCFDGCFFEPWKVAAVIRTNCWQLAVTDPRYTYGCQNTGQTRRLNPKYNCMTNHKRGAGKNVSLEIKRKNCQPWNSKSGFILHTFCASTYFFFSKTDRRTLHKKYL